MKPAVSWFSTVPAARSRKVPPPTSPSASRLSLASSTPEESRQPGALRAQAVRADAPVLHLVREAEPQAQKGIRAAFDSRGEVGQVRNPWGEHIDDAVYGARAIHGRARPAQHFDGAGLFVVGLEHLVQVAEADRPNGQIVFRDEECATATRAGQHRGADAAQALGAAAALDVDAGDLVQRLGLMFGAEFGERFTIDLRHAGRCGQRIARFAGGGDHDGDFRRRSLEVAWDVCCASSSAAFAPSGSIANRMRSMRMILWPIIATNVYPCHGDDEQ